MLRIPNHLSLFLLLIQGQYSKEVAENEEKLLKVHGLTLPNICTDDSLFQGLKVCKTSQRILDYFLPQVSKNYTPINVGSDGNCLFRATSCAVFGTEDCHLLLRLLSCIEVALHKEDYGVSSEAMMMDNVEIGELMNELCQINSWQSISTIYALSAVLRRPIVTLYPEVCHPLVPKLTRTVCGRGIRLSSKSIATIMFTSAGFDDRDFLFNHFVPIICKQSAVVCDVEDPEPSFTIPVPNVSEPTILHLDHHTNLKKVGKEDEYEETVIKRVVVDVDSRSSAYKDLEGKVNKIHQVEHTYNVKAFTADEKSHTIEMLQKEFEKTERFSVIRSGTEKDRTVLVDKSGFKFVKRRRYREEVVKSWRCSRYGKGCQATVAEVLGDFSYKNPTHNHEGEPAIGRSVQLVKKSKHEAVVNRFCPPDKIVMDIALKDEENYPEGPLPVALKPLNLKRRIQRLRAATMQPHPSTLYFTLPPDPNFVKADMWVNREDGGTPGRHIIMATDGQLKLLATSKLWCLDGTFSVVRKPFAQLYTIGVFLADSRKQVPVVFILMSSRKAIDYEKVFQKILELVNSCCQSGVQVTKCMLDFETAAWSALRTTLPQVELKGCNFHFRQAIWRQVQKSGELCALYNVHKGTTTFVQNLMALSILPEEKIGEAFLYIREGASGAAREELLAYFERTWIERRADWCMFKENIRTNNSTEGWNHRLNRSAGKPNLVLWELLELLKREAHYIGMLQQLNDNGETLQKVNKRHTHNDKKLKAAWMAYDMDQNWKSLLSKGRHI